MRLFEIIFIVLAIAPTVQATKINHHERRWWKEAVVYQVYPRSFKDSNGDGIGDLQGVISKLDHIKNLGANVIWLSPHFDSPNIDNGYDIRNYRKVMTEFGTMEDFDALVRGIKTRGMKLIIDLVVNHTSDQHEWFTKHPEYYLWRSTPNNWVSIFSGSAWEKDPTRGDYYLHLFDKTQPDLNWDNEDVRKEVYGIMEFWIQKGADGFRMDVIPFISKDPAFPDLTDDQLKAPQYVYANGPRVHEYLQEMNRKVLSRYDLMTVGEAYGTTLEQTPSLVAESQNKLNMLFNFDAALLSHTGDSHDLPKLKSIYAQQNQVLGRQDAWNTIFLSNHDVPRLVSTFGSDSPEHRVASAKLLATMLLTLKGTPFIYQGDELGMTNYPFQSIDEVDDIQAKNYWKLTPPENREQFFEKLRQMGRDNARTPMQWDGSPNAGFTTAQRPWLAVNPNYVQINAENALKDPDSIYHYYKKLLILRQQTDVFVYGDYEDLDPTHLNVFVYRRILGKDAYLVVLNFSDKKITYALPNEAKTRKLNISNLGSALEDADILDLQPWDARIYHLKASRKVKRPLPDL